MIHLNEQPTGADDLIYRGERHPGGVIVTQRTEAGIPLSVDPRNDLANHSPCGFEWGYGGSGPCQLALAILAHALDDDALALDHYMRFKNEVIAQLGRGNWQIRRDTIRGLVAEYDRQDYPGRYPPSAA